MRNQYRDPLWFFRPCRKSSWNSGIEKTMFDPQK